MRSPGGDRAGLRIGFAALSCVLSLGQALPRSALVVTVPLRQPDVSPPSPPSVTVSPDGRFVAFVSAARLAPDDDNDRDDVYVLDRESGAVTLETGDGTRVMSHRPTISEGGRILVYESMSQVLMVRDRGSRVTRPLQRGGELPNGPSRGASISGDGRYIAFASAATDLVDGPDANGLAEDVYVADTTTMTFRRISIGASGSAGTIVSSFGAAISEDGRFVAFSSTLPVAGASTARAINVYVYDQRTGAAPRVSVTAAGRPPDGSSYSPTISSDGRYVAFVSEATNLVDRHDRNRVADVYLRDTVMRTTELVSSTPSGQAGNGPSRHPVLSGDGSTVVFQSDASDLACGERCPQADRDINLVADVFRRDRRTGVTELISRGRTPWMEPSAGPATDRTGSIVAFVSRHPLDPADDRHDFDLFVWARR